MCKHIPRTRQRISGEHGHITVCVRMHGHITECVCVRAHAWQSRAQARAMNEACMCCSACIHVVVIPRSVLHTADSQPDSTCSACLPNQSVCLLPCLPRQCVCLFASSFCLPVNLSARLPVNLSACLPLFICLPVCRCLSVCLSQSVCPSTCQCLPVCRCLSVCLSRSVCMPVNLSACLPLFICLSQPICLLACPSASVPLPVHGCLPIRLPVILPVHLPVCRSAGLLDLGMTQAFGVHVHMCADADALLPVHTHALFSFRACVGAHRYLEYRLMYRENWA